MWLWDVLVIKVVNGNLVWQKSFGKSDGPDHGSDVLETSDGGFLVLGDTSTYGQGNYDLWLIKLTADGTEQWNNTLGGTNSDLPKSIIKAVDGGYLIVGQTDVGTGIDDVWVVKTYEAGQVSWQKTFGDASLTENGICVKTESNGYIILANLFDANWTESIWLLHLDAQGTLLTDQHIYEKNTLHGTSITKTVDGGYFVTGVTSDITNYVSDLYLVKLDYQGTAQWVKIMDISFSRIL